MPYSDSPVQSLCRGFDRSSIAISEFLSGSTLPTRFLSMFRKFSMVPYAQPMSFPELLQCWNGSIILMTKSEQPKQLYRVCCPWRSLHSSIDAWQPCEPYKPLEGLQYVPFDDHHKAVNFCMQDMKGFEKLLPTAIALS